MSENIREITGCVHIRGEGTFVKATLEIKMDGMEDINVELGTMNRKMFDRDRIIYDKWNELLNGFMQTILRDIGGQDGEMTTWQERPRDKHLRN